MRRKLPLLLVAGLAVGVMSGCATVQPWERDYLALPEMAMDDAACHRFERNSEVYREGAIGANGGKSGGGCGCT